MDDEAMRWLCYHRPIASPHRPSHRLIVHRIASSSIASPHCPSHRLIASPHRPSHRLIVHRIASSSIALDIIRNASVSLLGHHRNVSTWLCGCLRLFVFRRRPTRGARECEWVNACACVFYAHALTCFCVQKFSIRL